MSERVRSEARRSRRSHGRLDRSLSARHRHLRGYFDRAGIAREWSRYDRSVMGVYQRTLIERFLARHSTGPLGTWLEIGPGPGRFSQGLARQYSSFRALDLSRPMLRSCRARLRRVAPNGAFDFVEGSVEAPPFRARSFNRVVALGVLRFTAREFPRVLGTLAQIVKPRGKLLFEIQTPSQATMTLLPANPPGARVILRRPRDYHVWSVIREGYQPLDPGHMAKFEVIWRRPAQLFREVRAAGLRIVDVVAIAPNFGNQPALLRGIQRDPQAYATALDLEEETGRWPELLGAGAGLLVAARPIPG